MAFCLESSREGRLSIHTASSEISMALTWEMSFPSMRKQRAFPFSRVPWHTGQTTLSSMSPTTPGQLTISESAPSPTRKNSSEPYITRVTASSGRAAIGSYSEKPCFRDMERSISNFFPSRMRPSGTIPPSAIETSLSGMMLSMFTSTTVPSPLQ